MIEKEIFILCHSERYKTFTFIPVLPPFAKANSACLLDRVSRVGEEHRQAARRRAWVKKEEERIQAERKAFWHANIRARGLNTGQLMIH